MFLRKLRKMPVWQWAALVLILGFAVVAGGCSDGKTGDPAPNTPTAADYIIENLNQSVGSVTDVTVRPKTGKSTGTVTVYYAPTGSPGTKSTTLPTAAGTYAVTFDVAAASGWNAATGLVAGTLVIGDPNLPTPTEDDYLISDNLNQVAGSVTPVTVTAKDGKSTGTVTVYYASSTYPKSETPPTEVGSYTVTFDVAAVSGSWNAASSLPAGTLVITAADNQTPVADDYNFDRLSQTEGGVVAVTVTPKLNKSSGEVTIYYAGNINGTGNKTYPKTDILPTAAGTYTVTFDVAAAEGWNPAIGLVAGPLTITEASEPVFETLTAPVQTITDPKNYTTGPDALGWGTSTTANVLTLGLTPGKTTSEINLNWYSTGSTASKVAQVRFVKGTFTAGNLLTTQAGTVAEASAGYTQHKATVTGLEAGSSYQYAVSSDGTNWSDAYNFKTPPATGTFRFAVVADPQLTTGNVDANSRYPALGTTTAAGWLETMSIIMTKDVSFIASGGDQVDLGTGSETEYTNFFAPPGLRSLPFAPVSGNHDNHLHFNYHYNLPNPQTFPDETVGTEQGRNYFYLYNNILFVVLNTAPYPTSTSLAEANIRRFDSTLDEATKAYPSYDWLIVQHHKSTASVADHLADTDIQFYVEAGFENTMSKYKVDFVLAGHDHVYARSFPLSGRGGGKVSVPDKSKGGRIVRDPSDPIYLTFTTGSGLKYYAVSSDPTFDYNNTLYVKNNTAYPYLGDITDADGNSSTFFGSDAYMNGKRLPVSNVAYVQPYIPSYTIAEVKTTASTTTITFKTYAIKTASGTSPNAAQPYSFDASIPYDWVQVTKSK